MKTPIELRVKYLSLAAEQKIIRRLELRIIKARQRHTAREALLGHVKLAGTVREDMERDRASLHHHRTAIVRKEARTTHLARMFLRKVPYKAVEKKCYTPPPMDKVLTLALRYGGVEKRELTQKFEQWMQGE